VLARLRDWFDHRTGYRRLMQVLLLEHVPGGAKWRYVWGSTLLFVFSLQVITGLLLMTSYSAGDSTAWGSVYFIQYEMEFGWLIRGLHHFGSQTMVVLLALHMLQVVIAGAQLPPREVNWWLGLALMGCVLGLSLTGYLLPWDQKGYWATQVATGIAGSMPGIGSFLKRVIVGGPEYGNHTLTRFYALHVGVLPFTVIVLAVLHLTAFRRHGVTVPREVLQEAREAREAKEAKKAKDIKETGLFWPDQAFKDMVACMIVFAVLLVMVIWGGHGNTLEVEVEGESSWWHTLAFWGRHGGGANLDAPADPSEAYPARPEWYFLFLFQLLKYFKEDTMIVGTVVIPNGVGLLLALLPLFGYGRMRPFGRVIGVVVVVGILAGAGTLTFLAIADDLADPVGRFVITQLAVLAIPLIAGVLLVQLGLLGLLRPGALRRVVFVGGVAVLAVLSVGTALGLYGALGAGLDDPGPPLYRTATRWWWPAVEAEAAADVAVNDPVVKDKTSKIVRFRKEMDEAEEKAERAIQLAHKGIPSEGAVLLLQRDPMTAGKALFEKKCLVCHSFSSVFPNKGGLQASDLAGFASPDPKNRQQWIRGLLHDPSDVRYFGPLDKEGKNLTGQTKMIDWATKQKAMLAKLEQKEKGPEKGNARKEYSEWLDAVSTWLASRPTKGEPDDKDTSPFAEGYRAFFSESKTKGACITCHQYKGEGATGGPGPDLTGYTSPEWARLMIMAPAHKLRYPNTNKMPAFGEVVGPGAEVHNLLLGKEAYEKSEAGFMVLTDVERELIIRFMFEDDRLVFFGRPVSGPPKDKKK
jgi:quinol-cytochrome oxidoreductase complex cytochrome b subunit/mono/diheme cytochrome c family protein